MPSWVGEWRLDGEVKIYTSLLFWGAVPVFSYAHSAEKEGQESTFSSFASNQKTRRDQLLCLRILLHAMNEGILSRLTVCLHINFCMHNMLPIGESSAAVIQCAFTSLCFHTGYPHLEADTKCTHSEILGTHATLLCRDIFGRSHHLFSVQISLISGMYENTTIRGGVCVVWVGASSTKV